MECVYLLLGSQWRHNLICGIHEDVFKLYLWYVDDFLTNWPDNFYEIGGAYKFLLRRYLLASVLTTFRLL